MCAATATAEQCAVVIFSCSSCMILCVFVVFIIFSWIYSCGMSQSKSEQEREWEKEKVHCDLLFFSLFVKTVQRASKQNDGWRQWIKSQATERKKLIDIENEIKRVTKKEINTRAAIVTTEWQKKFAYIYQIAFNMTTRQLLNGQENTVRIEWTNTIEFNWYSHIYKVGFISFNVRVFVHTCMYGRHLCGEIIVFKWKRNTNPKEWTKSVKDESVFGSKRYGQAHRGHVSEWVSVWVQTKQNTVCPINDCIHIRACKWANVQFVILIVFACVHTNTLKWHASARKKFVVYSFFRSVRFRPKAKNNCFEFGMLRNQIVTRFNS